jgi:nicotinate dehydrogenase subunit A
MIAFQVNGRAVQSQSQADTPLLDVLRNELDLKGSRYGCGLEQCGTCLVLVDGVPAHACTREVGTIAGRAITTAEGLAGHPIHAALLAEQAGQCGYCLSGIMVAAAALLETNRNPTRAEIAAALDGNLCRCGTHTRILKAVERAASVLREERASGAMGGEG